MTITTKYNVGDIVWFIFSHKSGVGKIDVCSGTVKTIFTQQNDDKLIITYQVFHHDTFHEEVLRIEEQFLFTSKSEIFKFFTSNIKIFIENPNKTIREKKPSYDHDDDLPF